MPQEWRESEFWQGFSIIYCGHDNDKGGSEIAKNVAEIVGKKSHRVKPPAPYNDWTDYFSDPENTIQTFEDILTKAKPMTSKRSRDQTQGSRHPYTPINVQGAYHNGRLYYVTETLVKKTVPAKDKNGKTYKKEVEYIEPVAIRSDRKMLRAVRMPAPECVPDNARTTRLSDGTLIDGYLARNKFGTWHWKSIEKFLDKYHYPEPLNELIPLIRTHLRHSVWLPHDDDYAILTTIVVASYCQEIFQAVPLILVNGQFATGKSRLGVAIAELSANSHIVGQISAASIVRLIHESRGLVVLDDLEAVAKKSRSGNFDELLQALKVSYNKATAKKMWTDVKTMKTEQLNFFGIKIVNNTLGVDKILGSRMLRIQTRNIPKAYLPDFSSRPALHPKEIHDLKNNLHSWVFNNVGEIAETYQNLHPSQSDRFTEITAPLRVISALSEDNKLQSNLTKSLARQQSDQSLLESPEEILLVALKNIILAGFRSVTMAHIKLEMQAIMEDGHGQEFTSEIPEFLRPEWIGRQLSAGDYTSGKPARQRIHGVTQTRVQRFRDGFVNDIYESANNKPDTDIRPDALDFCQSCSNCKYNIIPCEIRNRRQIRNETR